MATAFYPSPNTMAISGFVSETSATPQPQPEEQYISTFFCRALYDYQTDDTSSLSFHKNDIIEVLTRLESGWWDGLLGDERGWFPSNYVTVISDQEAEAAFSASEPSVTQSAAVASSVNNDPIVDMAHSMSRSLSSSSRDNDWLESDLDYQAPATQQQPQQQQVPQPRPAQTQTTQADGHTNGHSDFWVPQVSQDGRIFYVNTQTGQHSQDLPQEGEPDGDLAALSPSAARPVNTAEALAAAEAFGQAVGDTSGTAGFGLPRRSRTPEPWMRRLADDGLSYYYQNKQTGQFSWTLPDSPDPPALEQSQSSSSAMGSSSLTTERLRSGSTATQTHKRSASVYSDDSDVQPLSGGRNRAESSAAGSRTAAAAAPGRPPVPQPSRERLALTDAEEIAKSVQTSLFPAPPESPMELAQHVRDAVTTVTDYLQATGPARRPEQAKEIDSRVLDVVAAVRNLLYVTATPTGHVPSHLYPRGSDSRSNSSSTALQQHLKAAHRKVAGTLSKLVLSALALQYDPTQAVGDKPNRMEGDAKELERSVVSFVVEVQKYQEQYSSGTSAKRLQGVFGTDNIGLALPGAGIAASWKGFGYVAATPGCDPPARSLQVEVITESRTFLNALNVRLTELVEISHNNTELLQAEGQSIIAYLSALLAFINDVNVAQHVDIDGLRAESGATASYSRYVQTVERARFLLRKLELATQALYDDSITLFMTIQQSHVQESYYDLLHVDRSVDHDQIDNLVQVISSNLTVTIDVLDGLFTVGREQANIGQAAYHESIKWRQSRLSIWDGNIDPFMHTPLPTHEEDVVDLADAFSRPGGRPKPSPSNASESATLYENGTHSEISLGMSDRSRSEDPNEPITPTWPSQDAAGPNTYVRTGSSPEADELTLEDQSSPLFDDFDEGPSVKAQPRAAHKLMKLLGSDAPQHYLAKLTAEAKPWYLRPNYDQSEILIDPDGGVRAGTTTALVERLTAHEHGDPTFIKNFLMTFRSFMTLQELFDLLVNRFWIQPPSNLSPSELEEWTKLKQHVIRMRVLNTFKTMVTDEEMLEKDDLWILDKMKEFASKPEVITVAAAKQLLILIERAGGDGPIRTTQTMLPSPPPPPILPKSSKKMKLLDIDPTELARQLTLMEATLYKRIRPMECLQRSRESKPGKVVDNITSIIQLSNRIANWVADSILEREDSRKRAIIVKHFISVADRCRGLQNYSTMVAIISGLNTPPIRRLKRTWEQVNQRFMTQLSNCESTIDTNKNFTNYRQTLASISPPAVPFIGVYLTTLTFINDGAEDKLSGHMINFRKRQKAAEVIQDIKRWQSMPFSLTSVATILSFLEDSFNKYVDGVDYGDQFWNLSLEREPREREDEKMARLLQESGFL